jgi:hypothetical protein
MPDEAPETPPPAPETKAERRARALAEVAEYRKAYPGDARTDERLLTLPNGGYELADLEPERLPCKPELLRRLSLGAIKPAVPAAAPVSPPQPEEHDDVRV